MGGSLTWPAFAHRVRSTRTARCVKATRTWMTAYEDAAASEVRRLGSNLRPLLLVWLIAPLLGLLGTVWGMIEAFSQIALAQGLGKPELLAAGIYQALTTTAAGLAVSIPAIVAHHYLKGRIERFARSSEELYREVDDNLGQLARA